MYGNIFYFGKQEVKSLVKKKENIHQNETKKGFSEELYKVKNKKK